GTVYFSGLQAEGGVIKGIVPDSPMHRANLQRTLKEGSIAELDVTDPVPGIILGSGLAASTGMTLNARITVISPGAMTPYGPRAVEFPFRVIGIFESGFYEIDRAWAFTTFHNVQQVLSLGDVANSVELQVEPLEKAQDVAHEAEKVIGPSLSALSWLEQNR